MVYKCVALKTFHLYREVKLGEVWEFSEQEFLKHRSGLKVVGRGEETQFKEFKQNENKMFNKGDTKSLKEKKYA